MTPKSVAGPMSAAPKLLLALVAALVSVLAASTPASAANAGRSGGAAYVAPQPEPGRAVLAPDGATAVPPTDAPFAVKAAILAANRIVGKPYKYGGGHGRIEDSGYDCSGTVSYALVGADLIETPLASGGFMSWGRAGKGRWISVYAHGGHAYAVIAGLRLDTSGPGASGPNWRPQKRSSAGFVVRHPRGL